jgi:hypothetical protein
LPLHHRPTLSDQPSPDRQPAADPPQPHATSKTDLIIKRVTLAGSLGIVLIVNRGTAPVALSTGHLCHGSHALALNATVLEPGRQIRLHLGAGTDTPDEQYAAGRLGEFAHDGELALYNNGPIGLPSTLAAYLAWGSGGPAQPIAQAARLWGDTNIDAARGDTIALTGSPTGAPGYLVHRRDARVTGHPDPGIGNRPVSAPSAPEGRAPW